MSKNISSLLSESYWLKTGRRDDYPNLEEGIETEVAVIGGGIAGILTAYHLVNERKKVALFERFRILNGTTGNTTAKLSAQHGLIYADLIKRYGKERARQYYQANMEGVQEIKKIGKDLNLNKIVTDETTYTFTTEAEKVEDFKKEIKAYKELGIKGEFLEKTPLNIKVQAAISMENQGIFHSVEFLNKVLKGSVEKGLKVFENTRIDSIEHEKQNLMILKSHKGHAVKCQYVVFATHYPTIEKDEHYTQLWPRTTLALAYKTGKKLFEGAHIAYDKPSITLRTMEYFGDHYFLIGGQSHVTGDGYSDAERYEKIHALAQKLFEVKEPAFKWSTHDLMTKDHIPFMGKYHPDFPNAYVITGLNAWGLANSSIGAKMITDLICKRKNPYVAMYDPYREMKALKKDEDKDKNASSSQVNKVNQSEVSLLENDKMTVLQKDDEVGVYKDVNGKLHYFNISCTHMGCELHINDGDKTWDCPCHGSRFDKFGKVIYGPAIADLEKKKSS